VKLQTALTLGRVSNLPTVWTNTLAGALLAGARDLGAEFALVVLAFSLFYTGGMFLNDAFDAPWDARERPERPIPSGAAGAREVFLWGFARSLVHPAPDATVALGAVALAALGIQACLSHVLHVPAVLLVAAALIGSTQVARARGTGSSLSGP